MIDMDIIDPLCVPLVEAFNEAGLPTLFSCEGHELECGFYIMFADEVDDDKIIDFLHEISAHKETEVPFKGRINKWARKVKGEIKFNWMYHYHSRCKNERERHTLRDARIIRERLNL